MATEDGSVKIKVNMDITDVGAGVKDIAGQLKRVNVAAGNASETLKSALVNAVDAATGKSVQGKIFSLGSKLAALGPTFQKALAGNKAAVNDFQAKTADIAESITSLWNGLKQLGDVQYASPSLDALNGEIDETDKRVQELAETVHNMREAGSTVKNDIRFKQLGQEFLQAIKYLDELKAKREELIKSGEGILSFKDTAEFKGMAASLDAVSGRMTGMQERLVEAAINAEAARREAEAAAAAEAAAQEEAARLEDDAAADHLEEIAQSAQVSSQAVIRLTQELEQLQARQQELNAAGVGMGYAEYDANAERIRAVTAALREYSETGSDVSARALTQTSAWERFKRTLGGVAGKLRSVASACSPVGAGLKKLGGSLAGIGRGVIGVCVSGLRKLGGTLVNIGKGAVRVCVTGLKKLGGALVSVGKGAVGAVKSGVSKLVSGLRNVGSRAKSVNTGLDKMVKSIRNIGLVSVALSICKSLFGELRSVVSSCVSSNEAMSAAVDRLKARISNALAPAISVAINLLGRLMPYITALADAFASLMANIFGKSWTSVSTGLGGVADAAGAASDAVKDLNKNMSGLDELNTWQDKDAAGSGGSGGGSSSTAAPDTGSQAGMLPAWMTDLAEKIKEAIEAGDWYGAGAILAEKINGLIDSFDAEKWGASIGGKLQNGLTFLEGLLDGLDTKGLGGKVAGLLGSALNEIKGETIGATLAAGIEAAFRFVEGFMAEYKGPNIGTYLADIVNGWFSKLGELDENGESGWTRAGRMINNGIKSIIDGAAKFIDGLDTETISRSLNDFFAEIKWGDIAKNVRVLFETASEKDWEGVGAAIGGKIGDALRNIDPNDIAVPIASVFKAGIKLLTGVVEGYDGPSIGAYLADVVNGWFEDLSTLDENGESAFTRAGKIVNDGINGLITGITAFIGGLNDETITTAMKQFFGQIKWGEIWDNLIELGRTAASKKIWKNMLTSLWNAIANIAVWFREEILGISSEEARKPWDELETKLETASDEVTWLDALQSLALLFGDIATTLINMIPDEGLSAVWDTLKQKLATSLGATDWEDLKSQLWDSVGSVLESLVDELGALLYEKMMNGGMPDWLMGILFPKRSDLEEAIERYKKDMETDWGPGAQNAPHKRLESLGLSADEVKAIEYLYKSTGGNFTSSDVLAETERISEFKIKVQAVIDKIKESDSLTEWDKRIAMTALLITANDDSLPEEYRELVMDAVVQTVDSTNLKPEQRSIVLAALINTVNSKELGVKDKSLVMTALIHAVDGTGLTPEDRTFLMNAELTDVIDAIAPEDKEVGGVFKGTSFTNGLKSNPIINAVSKFVSSVLGLKPEQRTINTVSKFVSSVLGLKPEQRTINTWANYAAAKNSLKPEQRTINTVSKFVSSVLGLKPEQRTINTWANYAAAKNSLKPEQRTINTVSKFVSSVLGLKPEQRTISTKANYTSANDSLKVSQKTIEVDAKATSLLNAIKSPEITVKAKISEIVSSAASKVKSWLGLATGGIYKNGRWEPIAGYAAGGSPRSARLFYANENGMPELVGRIGSSTAVMNNGQIVASVAAGVYRAVAAAFTRLGGWFSAMTARLGDIPPAIEMLSAMPRQIPQPVMATGTVLPPKAVYADGPVQGLADAVSGLRDALDRRSPDRSGTGREPTYNVNLNVDGQTLCRIVLREGRLRQLQSGGNPFMDLMGG